MPLSKKTRLALAKRKLAPIEEDKPAFKLRIAGLSPDAQEKALRWLEEVMARQLKHVRELENSE